MVIPEILAPAGGMEALRAAITNGADAVYLGGKLFSARSYATNFDHREIATAVKLAHGHQVRLYVTANILLHNDELEEAAHYLKFLYNTGVDGVIVQDLGLLHLAEEIVPGLNRHISTQMTVHNLAGVQFFAQRGVKRVVLARELSLQDLGIIRAGSPLELEVFVHGALCICYSGQCLMSSMIGGRSGNRGCCAQPCRLPYQLESEGQTIEAPGDYLLSPKDLCTIDLLPRLVASGVNSLKFEGRMKRPEYVATVIRVYRRALDRCLENPEKFAATKEEKRQLAQIFNRDFTTAYYQTNPGKNLISYQKPNNRGVYLGRINEIIGEIGRIKLKLEQPLSLGDGLEFWVSKGGRTGTTVQQITMQGNLVANAPDGSLVEIAAPLNVRAGDRVFKTHDAALIEEARASFAQGLSGAKIPVYMKVTGSMGAPLHLTVWDEQGNWGTAETAFLAEKARKRPLTKQVLTEQLGRLGDTVFNLAQLELRLTGDLMVPLSELNALRRAAISQLEQAMGNEKQSLDEKQFHYWLERLNEPVSPRPGGTPALAVAVGDPAALEAATAAGAQYIYINGEHFRSKKWTTGDYQAPIRAAKDQGVQVYYRLPRIWLECDAKIMASMINSLARLDLDGLVAGNPGAVTWAGAHFPSYPLWLDHSFNLMNDLGMQFLTGANVGGITLSPELTFQEIAGLRIPRGLEFEGLVHGPLTLMVSEHCPVGALCGHREENQACSKPCLARNFSLRDRKDFRFPMEMDQFCRVHIFNAQDMCLVEALPKFFALGYHRLRIEAVRESPAYVKEVTQIYRKALNEISGGQAYQGETWRNELVKYAPQGITKGHYFRGV